MKITQPSGVDFGVTTPTSGIRVGVLKFWNRHNPNVNAADALGAVEHVECSKCTQIVCEFHEVSQSELVPPSKRNASAEQPAPLLSQHYANSLMRLIRFEKQIGSAGSNSNTPI